MPGLQRLGDDLPSGPAGAAEDEELHVGASDTCRIGTEDRSRGIIPAHDSFPRLAWPSCWPLSVASVHAQAPQYRARLSLVPLDIAMQATIAGSGSVTATLKGSTLTITGTFSGLKTAATVARVHRGPKTAMRGVADRRSHRHRRARAERSAASIELTKEQVDDLAAGRLYVQLHSQKAPDGNLWGWLLAARGKEMKVADISLVSSVARLSPRSDACRCRCRPAAARAGRPAVYTAAQAAAGQAAYQANCASCHQPTSRAERGAAAGRREFHDHVGHAHRRRISSTTCRRRCRRAGRAWPKRTTSTSRRSSCVQRRGRRRAAAGGGDRDADRQRSRPASAPRRRPRGPAAARRRRARARRRSGAVARPLGRGEVKNYVPVTDAMLKNPPPGDWLMARRNYQAWSYSPLDEITRGNVKELKLAWSWSMNEAGANQPMPLVHNGIMYLGNTGNMMQALDAATGELIWENQVGPNTIRGFGAVRNIAIYRRQGLHGDQRRPAGRLRCAHRQGGVGRRRSPIRAAASPTRAVRSSRAAR